MKTKYQSEPCPMCDSGTWVPHDDGVYEFKHKRRLYHVTGLHYARCNQCGTRGYIPGQIAENSQLIKVFQSTLKDYISPSAVLELREKYFISQSQAAKIFKCGPTAFSKWERGEVEPTGSTALLLHLALENPLVMKQLAELAGIKVSLPQDTTTRTNESFSEQNIATTHVQLQHYKEISKTLWDDVFERYVYNDMYPLNISIEAEQTEEFTLVDFDRFAYTDESYQSGKKECKAINLNS